MKVKGKLERQRLGKGVWVLRAEGGGSYQLNGRIPPDLDGQRVQVEGVRAESSYGIAMVGEILEVKEIKAL